MGFLECLGISCCLLWHGQVWGVVRRAEQWWHLALHWSWLFCHQVFALVLLLLSDVLEFCFVGRRNWRDLIFVVENVEKLILMSAVVDPANRFLWSSILFWWWNSILIHWSLWYVFTSAHLFIFLWALDWPLTQFSQEPVNNVTMKV
jgi:hypothetical protein